jgi:ribonuclease HI
LKVNTDGAFLENTRKGGWGYVIRDEEGDVIRAGAGHVEHIRDAFQAEVVASIQGIQASVQKGITRVILETNSLILKHALENNSYRMAEVGGQLYELKSLISGSFSNFLCKFSPRPCNKVAHALAAKGLMASQGDGLRWETTPDFVFDLVASDAAVPIS